MKRFLLLWGMLWLCQAAALSQSIKFVRVLDLQRNPLNGNVRLCRGATFTVGFELKNEPKAFCPGTTFRVEIIEPSNSPDVRFSTITSTSPVSLTMDTGTKDTRQVRVTSIPPAGCDQRAVTANTEVIHLIDAPGVSVPTPANVCTGQPVQIAASLTGTPAPNDKFSYSWSGLSSPAFSHISTSSDGLTLQAQANSAGSYVATLSVNMPYALGCAVSGNRQASVNVGAPAVKPTVQVVGGSYCEGQGSATLSVTNGCPGTVSWSNGATGTSIVVSPAVSTTYTATCATTGACTSSLTSDPVTVIVTPLIRVDVISVNVDPTADPALLEPTGPVARGRTFGPKAGDVKPNLQPGDVLTGTDPRYWTMIATPCPDIAPLVKGVYFQLSGPNGLTFNTVENFADWVMFFNAGTTTYWTINDPVRGIGPAYNGGFPAGAYTLTVTLYDQQGNQALIPKDRTPLGNALGSKTYSFTVQGALPNALSAQARLALPALEEPATATLRTWPNPTTDALTLEVPNALNRSISVQLTDTQGRPVHQRSVRSPDATYREEISLRRQPAGLYLLRVVTEDSAGQRRTASLKVLKNE